MFVRLRAMVQGAVCQWETFLCPSTAQDQLSTAWLREQALLAELRALSAGELQAWVAAYRSQLSFSFLAWLAERCVHVCVCS